MSFIIETYGEYFLNNKINERFSFLKGDIIYLIEFLKQKCSDATWFTLYPPCPMIHSLYQSCLVFKAL